MQSTNPNDAQPIYCGKLGHHLQFAYCRRENNGLPCAKFRRCWQGRLDTETFLTTNYDPSEIFYLDEAPPPKLSTLIQLIQKAQASMD